jgi:hypothetical protein
MDVMIGKRDGKMMMAVRHGRDMAHGLLQDGDLVVGSVVGGGEISVPASSEEGREEAGREVRRRGSSNGRKKRRRWTQEELTESDGLQEESSMSGRDDGVGKEGGRKEDSGASDVGWEEGDLDFLDDLVDGHAFHETHHGEELVHGRAQKEEYVSSRRGKSRERLKSEKDKGRVRGTRKRRGGGKERTIVQDQGPQSVCGSEYRGTKRTKRARGWMSCCCRLDS